MRAAPLLLLAAWLGGCATGPASLSLEVRTDRADYLYRLSRAGELTVTRGSADPSGDDEPLFRQTLDARAAEEIARTLSDSGFLTDTRRQVGSNLGGSLIVLQAQRGLWENEMRIYGVYVDSVGEIIVALNRHLPAPLRVPYSAERLGSADDDRPPDWRGEVERDIRTPW